MAKKQKARNNLEEEFARLYKERGIEGNTDLLRRMYRSYYKDKPGGVRDREQWIRLKASDFGKMIKGERAFTESHIMAIERALGVRWVDILDPLPTEKGCKEKLNHPSLWSAAYYDDVDEYIYLSSADDADNYSVISNPDEYGKTIIDYILEYKSERGLAFLIENEYIYLNRDFEVIGRIYHSEDKSGEILDFLFGLDNAELFIKLCGENVLFRSADKEISARLAKRISETNGIFSALCKPFTESKTGLSYMSPIIFYVLKYALESGDNHTAQIIISAYERFLDMAIADARSKNGISLKDRPRVSYIKEDYSVNRVNWEMLCGGSTVLYIWNLSSLLKIGGVFGKQLEALGEERVTERLTVIPVEEMKIGDKYIDGNICYVKKDNDVGIWALKYLSGERECRYLPAYLGEERGVDKVAACSRRYEAIDFGELGRILDEIHRLSSEKLGGTRVYQYSKGMRGGFGIERISNKIVIASWEICEVGEAIDDFVLAFFNNANYYRREYDDVLRFTQYKSQAFKDLTLMLGEYKSKRVIERFGDKMNEALERMIKDSTDRINVDGAKDIEILFAAKAFAEIYRRRLNELTESR